MFQVNNVILSDDVAIAKFACDIQRCKGHCCVIGDAGAPVSQDEIPILKKAYRQLKHELRERSREVVENEGLIKYDGTGDGELNCTDGRECVFVTYERGGIAVCAIHKAFAEERFSWKKPISCHLFPLRIKTIGNQEFINYEYVPSLCSTACEKGEDDHIYLSEYLEEPLTRRYGKDWYVRFSKACVRIRVQKEVDPC